MDETHQPNTPYLLLLLLLFFFTLTVATQTIASVNCQTGSLRYPFGFTDGYPIRFNCSNKTGDAEIGEFSVHEIPPLCKRDIRKIEHLFRENYAPSISQNTILVQGCNESSYDCSIGRSFVQDRLNLSKCISTVRCLNASTEIKGDVMSVVDVVNRSGCKYWFSSITRQSKSQSSVNFGQLRLDWWLKEGCSNTTCSSNANCTKVNLVGGGFGHRCTCHDGFDGNAFIVHGGCRPVDKRKGPLHKLIVLGIAILIGASLIAILIFAFIYRNKRSASSSTTSLANRLFYELSGNSSVPFYTYKELEKATDNFSDKNKLGTGAYGTVYAGEFPNSSWVAIKRLRRKDTPSIDQVVNEIKLLSTVSHPNLVRLLGCCVAQGEPILVYEFMPNGTLSQHLQHERGHTPLSWPLRLSIASQTANAIAHLHSSVNPPIYHRDIKSSNILLDNEFNSKVSDFGLSRLGMSTDFDVSHISTAPQGTPGYLDPQYHQDFQLSDKSDVYSFGVVLIEIISGFKVIDFTRPFTEVNLAALAIDRIGRGRVVDIIDPSLQTENDPKMFASVQNLAELAFRCLSFHRNMRPTMIEVAEDLQRIKLVCFGKETRNSKNRSDRDMRRLNSK
ncbi:hypothetical protein N665_1401s0016 [Sinapis alba]|nr:hypothetical protein N665_1401s0016 [Sinapis alba]